jgi:hypothetical protein
MLNLLLIALSLAAPTQSGTGNHTSGTCSPVIISAQNVTVSGCGIGAAAAKRLQDSINRAIGQNNLTLAQTRVLVTMLNAIVAQNTVTDQKLDRIINDLESSGGASAAGGAGLVRDVLDRTVQRVDNMKITLTRVESGGSRISVYFDMVNEGVVEYHNIDVFGGGSFGNGGSSIILSGQEVRATGIQFAGETNAGLIRTDIVPRVRYTGRVDFDGVYGDVNAIDVFKLALSNNNLRPSARATFILSNR